MYVCALIEIRSEVIDNEIKREGVEKLKRRRSRRIRIEHEEFYRRPGECQFGETLRLLGTTHT